MICVYFALTIWEERGQASHPGAVLPAWQGQARCSVWRPPRPAGNKNSRVTPSLPPSLPPSLAASYHACCCPELGPDSFYLRCRQNEARAACVRQLHSEAVGDLGCRLGEIKRRFRFSFSYQPSRSHSFPPRRRRRLPPHCRPCRTWRRSHT